MKLDTYVQRSMLNYPTLHLFKDYEESRLSALHHVFLVLGNGMEWAYTKDPKKGGYPVEDRYRTLHGESVRCLDKPYGREKDEILSFSQIRILGEERIVERQREYRKETKETAAYLAEIDKKIIADNIERSRNKCFTTQKPYPFCAKYWLFAEIDPILIKPDWRQGMIDIKKWALTFFANKEKVAKDDYFGWTLDEEKLKGWASNKYNTWKERLIAYGLGDEDIAENDFQTFVYRRQEKNRLEYVFQLQNAINVLEAIE